MARRPLHSARRSALRCGLRPPCPQRSSLVVWRFYLRLSVALIRHALQLSHVHQPHLFFPIEVHNIKVQGADVSFTNAAERASRNGPRCTRPNTIADLEWSCHFTNL